MSDQMNGKTMFARYNLFHKPSCYLDSVWLEFSSADVAAKIEAPSDMMAFESKFSDAFMSHLITPDVHILFGNIHV